MRLLGRFNAVEAVYLGGLGQQRVVGAVGGIGKPIAVLSGRDDDFELPAQAAGLPSVGQTEAQRDRSRTPFRGEDSLPLTAESHTVLRERRPRRDLTRTRYL